MNILFVGCLYSDTQKDRFLKASSRGYQFAAQNLQEAIIDGFIANDVGIKVVSIPSLSTFPQGSRIIKVRDCDYVYKGKTLGRCFGYINIPFLKKTDYNAVDTWVDEWYNKTQGKRCIVVYAMIGTQMAIALRAKIRHSDIKIAIVVPDLPIFMGSNKYYKALGLQKKSNDWKYSRLNRFDAFVVLAEPMIENLGVVDKPYAVVEGIFSGNTEEQIVEKNKEITLLYSGALSLRYGIGDLLDAFMIIEDKRYRLWLCGTGDAVDYIKKCEGKDKRIKYFGSVSKSESEIMQRKATLLVNPRHSSEEFTTYSFPSKTIEYMASGTPTLMCHLPSIPPEYDEHLYYFTDESVDGMTRTIVGVCEKPSEELTTKGLEARNFILSNKNAKIQVKRIKELLDRI